MTYKSPINIYVAWHPEFKDGQGIAELLYGWFTRNIHTPLNRGIGISLFFRSQPQSGKQVPRKINTSDADHVAIVLLVEDEMFNDDNWDSYIEDELLSRVSDTVRLFPVALSKNAYSVANNSIGKIQFINGIDFKSNRVSFENELQRRLLHDFCRLMFNKQPYHSAEDQIDDQRVSLFISHAKMDNELEAMEFRDYVRSNTKLSTFFDANDIVDGYEFDTQILNKIEKGNAVLVVFHSDNYSDREWCRIEVLTAKRYKTPIVNVYNIQKGEKRSFPYMGNVPTIRLEKGNYNEIITLALHQMLSNMFHSKSLERLEKMYVPAEYKTDILTSPPELFNYLDIRNRFEKEKGKAKGCIVLYPDPPIGIEEIKILNEMDNTIEFVTPIQLAML